MILTSEILACGKSRFFLLIINSGDTRLIYPLITTIVSASKFVTHY